MKKLLDYSNSSDIYETVKMKCSKTYSNVLLVFCSFICCVMFLFSFLLTPKMVIGTSMYPTLNSIKESEDSDVVYILKQVQYSYGDIVVLTKNETQSDKDAIKRIIAMPGDKIEIKLTSSDLYKIFLNDVELTENYIADYSGMRDCYIKFKAYLRQIGNQTDYLILKEDEIFVLGDNRANSLDSSNYGPRKLSEIEGRVVLVVPQENKFEFKIIW